MSSTISKLTSSTVINDKNIRDTQKAELKNRKKWGGVLSNPQTDETIAVSEIFGPTIQGEGSLIGTQTIFVRTGGCDYRCRWCDTGYAVLPEYENDWKPMNAQAVFTEIETLSQQQPQWITLSGGNPALQDLAPLITLGQAKGYRFSMETQGSIAKPWFALLDQLTLSPKPPSSGMSFKARGLERCLAACDNDNTVAPDISLKFVIADMADLHWAKSIADQYPELPCYVQPCNTTAKLEANFVVTKANEAKPNDANTHAIGIDQQQQMLWLIDAVQTLNWHQARVLPQLHTWLWGDQTGV